MTDLGPPLSSHVLDLTRPSLAVIAAPLWGIQQSVGVKFLVFFLLGALLRASKSFARVDSGKMSPCLSILNPQKVSFLSWAFSLLSRVFFLTVFGGRGICEGFFSVCPFLYVFCWLFFLTALLKDVSQTLLVPLVIFLPYRSLSEFPLSSASWISSLDKSRLGGIAVCNTS